MGVFLSKYLLVGNTINDDYPVINSNIMFENGMIYLHTLNNSDEWTRRERYDSIRLLSEGGWNPRDSTDQIILLPDLNTHITGAKINDDLNVKLYRLLSLKKINHALGAHIGILIKLPTLKDLEITPVYKSTLSKYTCLMYASLCLRMSICTDVVNKIFKMIMSLCIYDHYFEQVCDQGKNINVQRGNDWYQHGECVIDLAETFRYRLKKWFMMFVYRF